MIARSFIAVCFAAALPIASAAAQTPADLVNRAAAAMGGEAALRGLTGASFDIHYATFTLGQSELPESPPRATLHYGRVYHDYAGTRRAWTLENRLLTGAVTRQRQSITPTMGMNEVNGQQNPMAAAARAAQMRIMRLTAERLMLTALNEPGSLSSLPTRTLRGAAHDGIRMAGTDTLSIWFDRVTGLPVMYEVVTDDPILGDRAAQMWWTRWQPAGGGLMTPRQYDLVVNGQLSQPIYFPTYTANPMLPESLFAIPDSIVRRAQAAPAPPATPAPLVVTMVQLGPSVWRAEGTTHHTLVIEQPDQIVLVEAPQSTQRVRAVLDTVRSRFPGKRIGLAVMTHYHWDHSGGIREIIAENIPVATLEANAAFVRQVAQARRTVQPDNQAQRRRNPTLRTFADSMVIGSGPTMVVLYRQPTTHAEGVLTAWVPSVGVLFTSDVVNPGAQGQVPPLGSAELVALARARGLSPQKYAGGHGVAVDWPNIERAASQQP